MLRGAVDASVMADGLAARHRHGHVLVVTLQRESALNARSVALRRELISAVDDADRDPDVRAIVLTGTGRAFSVGLDLAEAASRGDLSIGDADQARGEANDVARVAAANKPTIAAINGFALGGGLELAMACDIRVAAEDAHLGLPEVTRGTLPGNGGTQRLPRLIGYAAAAEAVLTGTHIPAPEALRLGLVSRVVPRERLLPEAMAIAERIAANAPLAVRYAKEALRAAFELPLKAGLAYEGSLSLLLLGSEDRREGIAAFREKRTPDWTGR